jgi:outer membrane protein insertion porin family
LGINNSNFYEKIETNSTASALQKKQEGNYWDSFIILDMNYDKRNQKFQTNSGFKSYYSVDLPIISETNTIKNYYNYSQYFNFFEKNFSSISVYLQSANSLNNKDIKLSERITIPSNRLRGFEAGRVGPKDGDDFIGGNYAYSINFASNVPQFFEESQNLDFLIFADAADIWGVDYDSSIKGNGIRSSIGVALDWTSPIGPLNFTLAYPVTKKTGDKTESFRFNLGTTF